MRPMLAAHTRPQMEQTRDKPDFTAVLRLARLISATLIRVYSYFKNPSFTEALQPIRSSAFL